jgi:hypothetical protein
MHRTLLILFARNLNLVSIFIFFFILIFYFLPTNIITSKIIKKTINFILKKTSKKKLCLCKYAFVHHVCLGKRESFSGLLAMTHFFLLNQKLE